MNRILTVMIKIEWVGLCGDDRLECDLRAFQFKFKIWASVTTGIMYLYLLPLKSRSVDPMRSRTDHIGVDSRRKSHPGAAITQLQSTQDLALRSKE